MCILKILWDFPSNRFGFKVATQTKEQLKENTIMFDQEMHFAFSGSVSIADARNRFFVAVYSVMNTWGRLVEHT